MGNWPTGRQDRPPTPDDPGYQRHALDALGAGRIGWASPVGSAYAGAVHAAVTVHIDAPPDEVWRLISDITRMGDYSPEVMEAEWLDGATGPAVGVRYRGHVKRNEIGPKYWMVCKITECEPGEVFEFVVMLRGRPINRWRYELTPAAGGTDVTESFDLGDNLWVRIWRPLGGFLRQRRNERDMRRTLERVKAVAEAST